MLTGLPPYLGMKKVLKRESGGAAAQGQTQTGVQDQHQKLGAKLGKVSFALQQTEEPGRGNAADYSEGTDSGLKQRSDVRAPEN